MKKLLKIILIILIVLIISGGGFALFVYYKITSPHLDDNQKYNFIVEKGEGVNQVSAELEKAGIISDNFYFDMYLWIIRSEGKIKAGSYKLSPSMSPQEIGNILIGGEVASEDKVTILEGWDYRDIASAFAEFNAKNSKTKNNAGNNEDDFRNEFLNEVEDIEKYKKDYNFLADVPAGGNLEGFLFPDTYKIYANTTPEELIRKMLNNFSQKVDKKLFEEIERQEKSLFEIIVLASIVEKEVREEEEMKKVAGVYYNRLDEGMNLQSDVTITYITGKKDPQPTFNDTRIESPYNTYLNPGLPPGPVGNPGITAIKAAVYPKDHEFLFFLTKLDTGEAIFSKTAEEHLENKRKYLE